ncbi:MAG: Unknown protein [uncultured Thiotrichaceae bacterium]|uniref:Uncharacterized protein n=1 Tax=uncultured Thiotrichaceae bacterium TaxID=298394 RepID=A0A6S6UA60_9GAMM|nr:MAG: Unknown protein [uncultured Thiotrichaceae bacterium]
MKKKTFHIKTGLACLFAAIPLPTLIFQALQSLETSGQFFLLGIGLQSMAGLLVIVLTCLFTLVLMGIAIYELGRYLIDLNEYDYRTSD